jgi:hypothetical protein
MMPLSSATLRIGYVLLALAGGCGAARTSVRPVAEVHERKGFVVAAKLVGPASGEASGYLQVEILNCDDVTRTLYWPSQHGGASWVLDGVSGRGDSLGGMCTRGIVTTNRPVSLEPGQKWTILCEAETFPPVNYRLTVHVTLETPEGVLKLTSTKMLDEVERVPVCRTSRDG